MKASNCGTPQNVGKLLLGQRGFNRQIIVLEGGINEVRGRRTRRGSRGLSRARVTVNDHIFAYLES